MHQEKKKEEKSGLKTHTKRFQEQRKNAVQNQGQRKKIMKLQDAYVTNEQKQQGKSNEVAESFKFIFGTTKRFFW